MKNFVKNNLITILGIIISIFIELFAITYTNCYPILTKPIYPVMLLIFIASLLTLIKNNKLKVIVMDAILLLQVFVSSILIFLYNSNGTIFEGAMFNQKSEGTGCIESLDLPYILIIICLILIVIYNLIINLYLKKNKNKNKNKNNIIKNKFIKGILLISLGLIILIPKFEINTKYNKNYINKLYNTSNNSYQLRGITTTLIYEILKGNINYSNVELKDIDNFIYKEKAEKSNYNAISKDNNLVLIMVESFEWYPLTLYEEYNDILFPNLTKLLNESIYANNYYQKEKTDVSEAMGIIGNYPTDKYINYDYYNNSYPYSLPSLIRYNSNEDITINSFHANYGTFYNRYNLHKSIGFDKLYAIDDMNEYGVKDNWILKEKERNLDSITFDKMKEIMFPTDKKFFSYIITYSMHGYYKERNNLSDYYEVLDKYIKFDYKNSSMEEYLRTYIATYMDLDKAIGIMMNYLKSTNSLDNTTIVLYADHNTYYNNLSNYVKNINDIYNSNLYNLPFIIYDKKLYNEYTKNNNDNKITKFVTASDIIPTILDIMGIDSFKNLYFGNSMFTNTESILYSRNYNIFITDKFVGYSLNNILYKDKSFNDEDKISIEKRAKELLEKQEYIDKIYSTNYFKDNDYKY